MPEEITKEQMQMAHSLLVAKLNVVTQHFNMAAQQLNEIVKLVNPPPVPARPTLSGAAPFINKTEQKKNGRTANSK